MKWATLPAFATRCTAQESSMGCPIQYMEVTLNDEKNLQLTSKHAIRARKDNIAVT
jgi:hypothetical protein